MHLQQVPGRVNLSSFHLGGRKVNQRLEEGSELRVDIYGESLSTGSKVGEESSWLGFTSTRR